MYRSLLSWTLALGSLISATSGLCSPAFDLDDDLEMVSRRAQNYTLEFVAMPDAERFQISRRPTAKWPKRETFVLKLGETSADRQFRLESCVEKVAKSEAGVIVDASELEITHLKSGEKHVLVRNVDVTIPTYFAEFRKKADPKKSFYVKTGDSFTLPAYPALKFKLLKAGEDKSSIEILEEGKAIGKQEIEKR